MILVDKIEASAKQHRALGEKLLLPPAILIYNDAQSVQQFSNNYYTEVMWCTLNRIVNDIVTMVAGRVEIRSTKECSSVNCSVAREDKLVVKT